MTSVQCSHCTGSFPKGHGCHCSTRRYGVASDSTRGCDLCSCCGRVMRLRCLREFLGPTPSVAPTRAQPVHLERIAHDTDECVRLPQDTGLRWGLRSRSSWLPSACRSYATRQHSINTRERRSGTTAADSFRAHPAQVFGCHELVGRYSVQTPERASASYRLVWPGGDVAR